MEWISVKDKMPCDLEKEEPTSFCCNEGVLVMAEFVSGGPAPLIGLAIEENNGWNIAGGVGFHIDTGYYELLSEQITHWKPIADLE